ncbi:ribosomal protein S18-alanine N-acetyltransferase [Nitrococcus mobilis]|uniref:[Ribosomal protein bS18]-alanine N-acetyltransferase n=1 Tax=Nitrococcus mobilis Nb-231 TaxID=314278 RepID=A4BLM1_9GAMM|nr:ribosomal protein S18-alanine N-acetyltransferase [Nitrococcus mobilis]EAR23209.1 ribosomal-protein-alanine acetyltransferase [Nitrococcus mobilis Nb-231]
MSAEPREFFTLIRPMREADLGEIIAIELAAYEFPWTRGIFRDCLRVGYDCCVHMFANQIVGYVVLRYGAGEAHILNIAVGPQWQNRGFGRNLLQRTLRQSARFGAQTLFLEVRPSNAAALHLYRSVGFCVVGRRRDYYPSRRGREDALILGLELVTPATG